MGNVVLFVLYDNHKIAHLGLLNHPDFTYESYRVPDEVVDSLVTAVCDKTFHFSTWDSLLAISADQTNHPLRCRGCWTRLRGEPS